MRLRLTLSMVEGDEVYQSERPVAQWEESEGKPGTWVPAHAGEPVSDAELPEQLLAEAQGFRILSRP